LFRFIVSVSSYLYTLSVSSMYRFSAGSFPHLSADCVPLLHVSILLFIKMKHKHTLLTLWLSIQFLLGSHYCRYCRRAKHL